MRKEKSSWFLKAIAFFLAAVIVFLLFAVPIDNIRLIVEKEWYSSTVLFGNWGVGLVGYINDYLGIDQWLQELVSANDVERAGFDLVAKLDNWLFRRGDAWYLLVVLLLLRLVTLLSWCCVFAPAFLISFICGWWQREESKSEFSFTSPYRMTKWTFCAKCCLIGLGAVTLCPIAINAFVMPLLFIVLVYLTGKMVSGLQKEI